MKNPFINALGMTPGVEQLGKAGIKTGLPAPGVESQAKARLDPNQGPMPPTMVNGTLRFQAPQPGISAPPAEMKMPLMSPATPAAGPDPAFMQPAQPVGAKAPPDVLSFLPKSAPAFNPLGGMDKRPLSERGAVPVGGPRKSVGQRTLERAARRGDVRAAAELANQAFGVANREDQQAHDMWKDNQSATRAEQGYQRTRADNQADTAANRSYQEARDAANHQQGLDVLQFQDNSRTRRDAAERDAQRGFSLQPLDPNDPSKGNAIMRGDGTLFNLLPGQKPEAPPPVLDFLRLPGTADAVPMYGDKPLPGAGIYTEQPGWSVKGLDQFMPKPKAQAAPTEILNFLPDGTLEGRTVRGPVGTVPTQAVKPTGDKAPVKTSGFAGRFSK